MVGAPCKALNIMVPEGGLEPPQGYPYRILSPARLPFHHSGVRIKSITYSVFVFKPFSKRPSFSREVLGYESEQALLTAELGNEKALLMIEIIEQRAKE